MMLDKKAVEMLLALDDNSLAMVIKKIASDAGVDPSNIRLGEKELSGIRSLLSGATDSDIARAAELLKQYKSSAK